jgi:hypothetical protein
MTSKPPSRASVRECRLERVRSIGAREGITGDATLRRLIEGSWVEGSFRVSIAKLAADTFQQ